MAVIEQLDTRPNWLDAPWPGQVSLPSLPKDDTPGRGLHLERHLPEPFLASKAFGQSGEISPAESMTLPVRHIHYWIRNAFAGSEFAGKAAQLIEHVEPQHWIPALLSTGHEAELYLTNMPGLSAQMILGHAFSQRQITGRGNELHMFNVWTHPDFRRGGIAEAILRRLVRREISNGTDFVKLGDGGDRNVERIHQKICLTPGDLNITAGERGDVKIVRP